MHVPTYRESIRIGWTLLWRVVGGFLALLFATNLGILYVIPEVARSGPSFLTAFIPLGLATAVSLFLLMPLVVRTILTKSFRGFRLQFVRESAAPIGIATTGV
jgi:uncharacterized membrane protein